jgi:Ca2+-binding RTX toxin-like protein
MQTFGKTITCHVGSCSGTDGDDVMTAVDTGPGPSHHIEGRGGNDVIHGSFIRDQIDGGDGNDKIFGSDGEDEIKGGSGNDKIDGGPEHDNIYGDQGNDFLTGADGDDSIRGGDGSDRIFGGQGHDKIDANNLLEQDFSKDFVNCGSLSDSVTLRSSDGDTADSNCETIDDGDG